MARIRSLKPKFWDDTKLKNISRDARLLFIGMWTFADDLGVILADPVWIKSRVFPYDNLRPGELENWISEITDQSMIVPGMFREEKYYFIKNFNKHQVINKPNNDEIHVPKDCISTVFNKVTSNPVAITDQSGSNQVAIRGGEERKGEERKGEERRESAICVFDAEKEILDNQIQFEKICMATHKDPQIAKSSLRKYHLYLSENEKYPKSRKAIFSGFEKWLLNERGGETSGNGQKRMVI